MADAPWRCSQCGTVNEPVANACRTCGRWPSLFDLESGAVDVESADAEETFRREAPEPREAPAPDELEQPELPREARPVEAEDDGSGIPKQTWPGPEDPLDRPTRGWPRVASWIVPIVIVVYIVISTILNR